MKSLILLPFLLVVHGALAQVPIDPPENVFTIKPAPYSTAHDYDCYRALDGDVGTFPVWLLEPVNPDFDGGQVRPVANVNGFEMRLDYTAGMQVLAWRFPVPAINVGTGDEVKVGFAEPVPVVDGMAQLAEIDVFIGNAPFALPPYETGPCYLAANIAVYVKPAFIASIPGRTAYLDADDPDDPLVPGIDTGDQADFRFLLTQGPVATEGRTWGTIKSLYR